MSGEFIIHFNFRVNGMLHARRKIKKIRGRGTARETRLARSQKVKASVNPGSEVVIICNKLDNEAAASVCGLAPSKSHMERIWGFLLQSKL